MLDASAVVGALVGREDASVVWDALPGEVHAPHLLDVEVVSSLRGLALAGKITEYQADEARRSHFALTIHRHPAEPVAERVWQLRRQYTADDACYLALAEALDALLVTADAKLASGGHRARIRLVGRAAPG